MSIHYRTTCRAVYSTLRANDWNQVTPSQPDMEFLPEGSKYEIELISTAANNDNIFWTWKITARDKDNEE